MIKHGLLVCSFQLRTKYKKTEELYSLNSPYEYDEFVYKNVIDMFLAYLKNYEKFSVNEKQMKLYAVAQDSVEVKAEKNATVITGRILCGSYGIQSNMTNKDTKQVVYNRKKEDADIKPFQFMIYVPKDDEDAEVIKGILLFEMIGAYGVKTITTINMRSFFSEKVGLTMELRSISVRAMLEKMLHEEKLNRITFIRNKISPDASDNIFHNIGREEKSYYKPSLKSSWVAKLLDFADGSSQNTDIFEVENERYEDIKLSFIFDGHNKTIRLMEMERFSFVEDIPDRIYNGSEIDLEKLRRYMVEIADSYLRKMIYTRQ